MYWWGYTCDFNRKIVTLLLYFTFFNHHVFRHVGYIVSLLFTSSPCIYLSVLPWEQVVLSLAIMGASSQVTGVDLISSLKRFTLCVFLALKAYIGFDKYVVLPKNAQIKSTLITFLLLEVEFTLWYGTCPARIRPIVLWQAEWKWTHNLSYLTTFKQDSHFIYLVFN